MIEYSLEGIAEIIDGELVGEGQNPLPPSEFFIDSRTSLQDSNLFFALKGRQFNAHEFIPDLIKRGVKHFVVNENYTIPTEEASYIKVKNVATAFQKMAIYHREKFDFPVIAITGSNAKTIVKEWLFQLLTKDYSLVKSPKSYNSQVGVPLSVFQIDLYHNLGIFEAGISTRGEMEKLELILQPDIGIFTNIGTAHDEGFSSIEEKLNEKLKLFENCNTIIYRKEHQNIHNQIQSEFPKKVLKAWSLINGIFQLDEVQITLPETANHLEKENLGHCIALLLYLGYSKENVEQKIKQIQPIQHRLQIVRGKFNSKLINDSYNNDFGGLKVALELARQQADGKPFTLLLSAFEQTGLSQQEIKTKLNTLLQPYDIEKFIGIGSFFKNCKANKVSYGEKEQFFASTEEFISTIKPEEFKNEIILIKGARSFRFETIVDYLRERSHDTVWEINLSAFTNNVQYFRSLLQENTRLMVMVKAFAYGTSAKEVARLLQYQKIDYLGVAYAEEGKALRKYGIKSPILVMNTSKDTFTTAVENNLEIETYSLRHLKQLIQFLQEHQMKKYPVHIKLDTGMHRLGFMPNEINELKHLIQNTNTLLIKGIFSHLSSADNENEIEFTLQQQNQFELMAEEIMTICENKPILHLLNSAGIVNQKLKQFDMVRLGIGAYGVSHNQAVQKQLVQVGSLKATISQLKTIKKGESVGYNRAFIAEKKTKIGIITIGYADGYDRRFGNGTGTMLIKGKVVHTVGEICMDMCMVDVSAIEKVNEGDEVVITSSELPITELAGQIKTIPYEILTNISARIPRRFIVE